MTHVVPLDRGKVTAEQEGLFAVDMILVALDLETTGLDPARDTIIEVGAVKFRPDGTIIDEYQTLVNPGRDVAFRIAQLTGITNEMLAHAPTWHDVREEVIAFIGQAPIVGHNIAFDLNFLQTHGVHPPGQPLDTFDLATMLLPGLNRYNLGTLAETLNVPLKDAHRALDDARATALVFAALLEEGIMLPWPVHQSIARIIEGRSWPYAPFFHWMRKEHRARNLHRKEDVLPLRPRLNDLPTFAPPPTAPVLHPREDYAPIDVEGVAQYLDKGGPLAQALPTYEHRPQQIHMLREVARALNEGMHLLVEAGTGTGKSLAYLIPAAFFAHANQERIVISTHTINLQDQLLHKDLVALTQALPFDVYATVLKGRGNYLCVRRLQEFIKRSDLTPAEITFAVKLTVWLHMTRTGDVAELGLSAEEQSRLWPEVASDANTCSRERCREAGDFYFIARDRAERSHLLIVNHALLLADISVENRALPPYQHLIVDEAHHLEDAVTQQLGYAVSASTLQGMLNAIYNPRAPRARSLITRVQKHLTPVELGIERMTEIGGILNTIADDVMRVGPVLERFWRDLSRFLREHGPDRNGPYTRRLRITPAERNQPAWSHVEISWDRCVPALERLINDLERLATRLDHFANTLMLDELADDVIEIRGAAQRLGESVQKITRAVTQPLDEYIYWIEEDAEGERLTLRSAPLHIGDLVARYLWNEKRSVIMTSATLRTGGTFDYLRERLNAWEAEELSLGSPYDYASSTLLYLPTDVPEPNQRGYQETVERALVELAQATNGRMLVLFTSYNQLRRTAEHIGPILKSMGITVYEQGMGGRTQLLENFRTTEKAILLGTRSFWEGVDVPGEALSVLVITRLPFAVPSDPIVQARSETYENPFHEYQVPQAILRFRQGFGRLIRSRTDRGVVVVLDRRIQTKAYGKLFLDSLPPCTVQRAPLAYLPQAARQWLENAKPLYTRPVE